MKIYLDESTIQTNITTAVGGNFENLVVDDKPAVTTITDTIDDTTVSLDATSTITEAGADVTYTATLTNASDGDTTVTLANGQTITIANGETSGSVVTAVASDEDVYLDESTIQTNITTAVGGNFENLVVDDKPAVTTITDTIDDTTVSLDATSTITEAGADVTYTATLTNASDGDTTVTLANGQTITIANGETSGSVVTAVASDEDVYLDESTIQTNITTAVGGNFENLVVDDKPAVTTITDTIDDTTVSLDATSTITEAGADVTYTATLTNASDGDTTVTLANGQTITIANGETSGSVVTAVASDEDVYLDESTIQTNITTAVGGNFENLVVDDKPAVTTITDTIDDTTVSLDATSTITEAGADVTYTATLTNASDGDTTVTLANGQTITIANGETSGSVVTAVASDEDVYLDESTIQTSITTAVGGNFENLVVDDKPAVTTITDTIDDTTVSLDATSTITEAGADVTYTATLTNASDGDTTVTLANGQTITIANGETSGSVVTAVASDEDVYLDESTIQTNITTAVGGNFENLVVDDKPAVTTITDTIDDTTVSLDATSTITEAGADVTYTATLTNASDGDTTVTLANGQTITIANGETSGSVVTAVASDEDVYLDESTIQTNITTAVGGNFENLVVDDKPAVTTITDTIDDTTVSLDATVVDASSEIVYTATLTSVSDGATLVTLSNGQTITIANGELTGTVAEALITTKTSITDATGGNFENLVVDATPVDIDNSQDVEALADTATATEDGAEFRADEDEVNDGQVATGNVLDNDTGDNLEVTEVTFAGQVVEIPSDGSNIGIDSEHGRLTINTTGAFAFVVNDDDSSVEALNIGDSVVDTFSYSASDGSTTTSSTLSINIEGQDDAPVINSIEANNQPLHTIDGVMDLDGDGNGDFISPEDLLSSSQNLRFDEDNGNIVINMGNENSSLAVDYHGGTAGYNNILGYYEKDDNGNITDVKIIYTDRGDEDHDGSRFDSFIGEDSINLGTINNINGTVGFFILPNGYSGDIKGAVNNNYDVSIDANNHVVFTNPNDSTDTVTMKKAYYTDNDMSTDGRDHAIVTVNPDGGLTIGMEDLPENSSDQDYDDVVFTIKPCDTLESGEEYFVDLGKINSSSNQYSWDADGSDNASWNNVDSQGSNVTISALDFDGSADTLVADGNYQLGVEGTRSTGDQVPNQLHYDGVTGQSQAIVLDFEGNLNQANFKFTRLIESENEQGHWATYKDGKLVEEGDLNGSGLGNNPTFNINTGDKVFNQIVFTAVEYDSDSNNDNSHDSSDYYLQSFQGSGPAWANTTSENTILNDINISDVDDANLEGATVTLKNFQDGDTLSVGNLPDGLSATVVDGVVEITGSATVQEYTEILESLTFESSSDVRTVRNFEFTVFDGNKHSNAEEVSVDIGGCEINTSTDLIEGEAQEVRVSEEGLVNGVVDNVGTDDTTDATVGNGKFNISSTATEVSLEIPEGEFTSAGEQIVWTLSNDGKELVGSTSSSQVLHVKIDVDGNYTTTLNGVIDHPDMSHEDQLVLPVSINVSDAKGNSESTTLSVVVEDDAPVVDADGKATIDLHVDPVVTNLSFVVDVSSSMSDSDLELSKAAIDSIVESYSGLGEVHINIVQFYNGATINSGWINSDDLANLTLDTTKSGTDIVQGLKGLVNDSYSGNEPVADQNMVYFFGDGDTYGGYKTEFNEYTGEDSTWSNFVTGGTIDKLMTYSVNTGSVIKDIEHLADNGENVVSLDPIAINNVSDLREALQSSVSLAQKGEFTTDSEGNPIVQFGADGGHLTTVTVAGHTVNYDANSPIQTVAGEYGTFDVDFDNGTYTYYTSTQNIEDHQENIEITVVDGDGDGANGSVELTINVTYDDSLTDKDTEPQVLLEESFENLRTTDGWHVEHGTDGEVVGDHGVVWDTNTNGVEIQQGIVTDSSDGNVHAELDAHGADSNVHMTTNVALTDVLNYTMSFDVKPRDGGAGKDHKDTSDMNITLDGRVISIESNEDGILTIATESSDTSITVEKLDNGWQKITVEYHNLDKDSVELVIDGTGSEDTIGMLLDNIRLVESTNQDISLIEGEAQEVRVSEEGLVNGVVDNVGTDDTTDATVGNGKFNISSTATEVSLEIPEGEFTSAGEQIVWTLSNDGKELVGSTSSSQVLHVKIDVDGNYTTTLNGVIDHPDMSHEDQLVLPVSINVSDAKGNSESTTLSVVVEDDAPVVDADGKATIDLHVDPVVTNLSFVVDVSSSMSDSDLELSKAAIDSIVESYSGLGEVHINIVQFYNGATINSGWINSDDLANLTLDTTKSGTDIVQGLKGLVNDSYSGNEPVADQNMVYFFGDGDTYGGYKTEFNEYTGEDSTWSNFVTGGTIDKLMTYSVNTGSVIKDIEHLADNGENVVSLDPIAINNVSDLREALQSSVSLAQKGEFTTDSEGNPIVQFGADGGHLTTVTVAGHTVNYDANSPIQTVAGEYGTFDVDFDNGTYTYYTSTQNIEDHQENIEITVVDGDGDGANGSVELTINVTYDDSLLEHAPDAVDDTLSNSDINAGDILVSEDFENGVDGWSDNTTTNTDGNATNFLGKFGGSNGEEAVSKVFDLGVEHAGESVNIKFDMYEIDSWDDETFIVFTNGEEADSNTLSHFGRTWSNIATDEQDGGEAIDNIGSSGKYWLDNDEVHSYEIEAIVDSNGEVKLGFGSTLNQSLSDESYGIDNLVITAGKDWSGGVTATEDTAMTIDATDLLANDSDVDGDTITLIGVEADDNTHGTVSLDANGNVVFTPDANYNGEATFTYTISDGNGGTDTATVSLNVDAVNDAPDAVDDSGEELTILLGTKEDVGSITDWGTKNDDGTVSIDIDGVTGTITATGRDGENSSINYDAGKSDGGGADYGLGVAGKSEETDLGESINISFDETLLNATIGIDSLYHRYNNPTEDASVEWTAYKDGEEVASGSVVRDVNDTDGDGSKVTNVIHVDTAFNSIKFASEAESGQNANFDIRYLEADVVVDIATDEDTAMTIDATDLLANDSDVDGDTITLIGVEADDNTHGTVSLDANGNVVFTPDANYNGEATFTYTISDGNGGTDTATVSLNVDAVNDAPDAVDDFVESTITETTTNSWSDNLVLNGDAESGKNAWTTDSGELRINDYTDNDWADEDVENTEDGHHFYGNGEMVVVHQDIDLSGIDGNKFNLSADIGSYAPQDDTAELKVVFKDVDGNIVSESTTGKINTEGVMKFTEISNDIPEGAVQATIEMIMDRHQGSDADGYFDNISFQVASEVTTTTMTIDKANILANDSDVDGDTITLTGVEAGDNTHGTVSLDANGNVVFIPEEGYTGEATFTYTISDGNGGTDTATVSLNVDAVKTEPQVLLEESFENLRTTDGWHVEHGTDGEVVGDHGVVWNTHNNGVEIQQGIVTDSSDGNVHAELDAHGANSNVHMTTNVALTDVLNYTMSFDVKPRDGGAGKDHKDTSDMNITLDGRIISVESDEDGLLNIGTNAKNTNISISKLDNGWQRVTVEYRNLDKDSVEIVIAGTGAEDTIGMLLDNIKLSESTNQDDIDKVDKVDDKKVVLEESFENLRTANGWHVEHGTDVIGDHGVIWDTHNNGLELQKGIVTDSSDGNVHAELDAHGANSNVHMTTNVALTDVSNYTMSFDVKPRDGGAGKDHKDTSDMNITLDDRVISVESDEAGVLTIATTATDTSVSVVELDNGWQRVTVEYSNLDKDSVELVIDGTGAEDTIGMLVDNIKIVESANQDDDTKDEDPALVAGVVDLDAGTIDFGAMSDDDSDSDDSADDKSSDATDDSDDSADDKSSDATDDSDDSADDKSSDATDDSDDSADDKSSDATDDSDDSADDKSSDATDDNDDSADDKSSDTTDDSDDSADDKSSDVTDDSDDSADDKSSDATDDSTKDESLDNILPKGNSDTSSDDSNNAKQDDNLNDILPGKDADNAPAVEDSSKSNSNMEDTSNQDPTVKVVVEDQVVDVI